jgi:hypothetical protein
LWRIQFSSSLLRSDNWKNSRAKLNGDCPPRLRLCGTILFHRDARRWPVSLTHGGFEPAIIELFIRSIVGSCSSSCLRLGIGRMCIGRRCVKQRFHFKCTAASVCLNPPALFLTFGIPYFGLMLWQPSSQYTPPSADSGTGIGEFTAISRSCSIT